MSFTVNLRELFTKSVIRQSPFGLVQTKIVVAGAQRRAWKHTLSFYQFWQQMTRNFTLVALFDIQSVLANDAQFIWKFGILAAVAYFIGASTFVKRDLPL